MFRWIPKKREEELRADPTKGFRRGWGIQYVWGIDYFRICVLVMINIIISLTFAVVWSKCKGDVQGAFTVGSTLFMTLTSGAGALEKFIGERCTTSDVY